MAVVASDILTKAGIILNDEDHVRWPLAELVGWLNDGQRAIMLNKPSANSETVVISLAAGTLQYLSEPTYLSLLRINCNITAADPRTRGRVVRPTSREALDTSEPNWHDATYVRRRKEVRQYVYDEAVPREFYVYPGNDGNGAIEAAVAVMPTLIAATGDAELIASYGQTVDLPEPWGPVLQDYVIYRAYAKDDLGADGGRGIFHYQQFAAAVGLKIQVEGANSPNSRARIASA